MRPDTIIFFSYFLESGVTHAVKCVGGFAFNPEAITKACTVLGVPWIFLTNNSKRTFPCLPLGFISP